MPRGFVETTIVNHQFLHVIDAAQGSMASCGWPFPAKVTIGFQRSVMSVSVNAWAAGPSRHSRQRGSRVFMGASGLAGHLQQGVVDVEERDQKFEQNAP